jgi:hypothetical protein
MNYGFSTIRTVFSQLENVFALLNFEFTHSQEFPQKPEWFEGKSLHWVFGHFLYFAS